MAHSWTNKTPEQQAEIKAKIKAGIQKAAAERRKQKLELCERRKAEHAKKVSLWMLQTEPQKVVRMGRGHPPIARVSNALARLSRDRWIPWKELIVVALSLLRCACWGNASTYLNRVADTRYLTGMIRGKPAFAPDSSQRDAFLDFIENPKNKKQMEVCPELVILNFKLKELS